MIDRPKINDFFGESFTVEKFNALRELSNELNSYLMATEYYIDELEALNGIITNAKDKQLTPIHKCIDIEGTLYGESGKLSDFMTVRLYNVCRGYELKFSKNPIYFETATFNDMYRSLRNFGRKCWSEFESLRNDFIVKH